MRRLLLPVLALVLACGNKEEPKTPSNLEVGKTNTPQLNATAKRGPSKEMAAHWVLGPKVDTVVYLDAKSLASSELVKGLAPTLLKLPDFPEEPKKCIKAILARSQEVLVGIIGEDRMFGAMRVDGTLEGACPAGRFGGKRDVVGYAPGWAFVGTEEDVKDAIAGKGTPLPDVDMTADQLLVARGRVKDEATFDGSLVLNNERFKLAADVTFENEDVAISIEKGLKQAKREANEVTSKLATDKSMAPTVERLLGSWSFSRTGAKLHLQMELVEGPEDQARDFGVMAALAISGVRKYIANAKTAEAKNACGQIAKDIVANYESEELDAKGKLIPHDKKKLFSLPPVPKDVPKGMKYQSSQADWKPWSAIKFEMSAPQYYQYEVKAAKDGKSADVIARGDLNGDGKTSEFKLSLVLKEGRIVVSPSIMETNPEE